MNTTVTALVVSHDGARWLPAVLDGLDAQTRLPDRLVAVDTGSSDVSADLLTRRLGAEAVHRLPDSTGFGAAVAEVLDREPAQDDSDWLWLLHDDSAPHPDALARLLDASENDPGAAILGPKLREWPSLRRLLEVGVTISGTGRRETGLEHGEYDQGQHDRMADVLAVNTAGMLVRRSVLESLGLDPRLPVFGNDLDFGWRAARAGHRAIVVPDAVVFHVEAAHRGVRQTPLTGSRSRRGERAAALYTLLANAPAASLPLRWVRLLLGSLGRALGLLLVRAPGEAADELVALGSVYARPLRILSARRRRRRTATVPHREVKHLLAPFWVPYRHGLDFVTDLGQALAHQASDATSARRARPTATGTTESAGSGQATETGPVPPEAQNLPADSGLVARLVTSPAAAVLVVLFLVSLWNARGLVGGGMLSGGALLPAPDTSAHWWSTYLASWHDLGTGSAAPAAPYLLPLALAGTVLFGKAWLVVDLVLLLCVPLAAWGGRRLLLQVTGSRSTALWGGVGYGLLPVLSGSVQQGRIGTVVVAVALPWLVHAALFLHPSRSADRRRRAAWRTALWLALTSAFAPITWVLAAAGLVVTLLVGSAADARWRHPGAWGLAAVPVAVAPVLLLPWSVLSWTRQGPASWLTEAGLGAPGLLHQLTWTDIAFGRPGEAAPWWLGLGVVLAAVAALARSDRRAPVLAAWLAGVVALATAAALAPVSVALAWESEPHPLWLGVPLIIAQGAAICAAALAGSGIQARLTGASFGWRQPVGAVVVVLALLSPVAGVLWWAVAGSGDPLDRRPANQVPAYMNEATTTDPRRGVLVVRGDRDNGLSYLLLRGPGLRLGDDSVLPPAEEQQPLTELVGRLATAPEPENVRALQEYGVGFIYAPNPADPQLAASLDSVSGLSQGSAIRAGARAWQLDLPGAAGAPVTERSEARPWLLAVQGVALVLVAVLAAPTRRVRR